METTKENSSAAVAEFIAKIKAPDGAVRYGAQKTAGPLGSAAIAPLSDLVGGADRPAAKAAKGALENIVHHADRPGAKPEARAVTLTLLDVAASPRPAPARAHALYLLGFAADGRAAAAIAKMRNDPEIGDEARMALERIPGSAARYKRAATSGAQQNEAV